MRKENSMNNYCYNCAARNKCNAAVEYGSVICVLNRMQSGQSKASFIGEQKETKPTYCAYCGKPLKIIGSECFCNNVQCINRYKQV